MAQSGWTDGSNVKIDVRWSGGDVVRLRKDAEELLSLSPDVIVAGFGPTTGVLQQLTRTVPIVFTTVVDPVGAGFVDSLARPGGNTTGFIQFEYTLSGKWLELLREIAPQVSRVGVVRTAGGIVGIAQWAVIGAFASPMGVELRPINVSVTGETERALSAFAGGPNSGLIVTVSDVAGARPHRAADAACHRRRGDRMRRREFMTLLGGATPGSEAGIGCGHRSASAARNACRRRSGTSL